MTIFVCIGCSLRSGRGTQIIESDIERHILVYPNHEIKKGKGWDPKKKEVIPE